MSDFAQALSMALTHVEALGQAYLGQPDAAEGGGDYIRAITDTHRELRALLDVAQVTA